MEAIAHLNEGLQALARWPKRTRAFSVEIELQLHLAMSYIGLEGWSGRHTDAAYRRALELSRRHGDLRQKSMALWGVSRSLLGTDLRRRSSWHASTSPSPRPPMTKKSR